MMNKIQYHGSDLGLQMFVNVVVIIDFFNMIVI